MVFLARKETQVKHHKPEAKESLERMGRLDYPEHQVEAVFCFSILCTLEITMLMMVISIRIYHSFIIV
jgi:hypothetical protein